MVNTQQLLNSEKCTLSDIFPVQLCFWNFSQTGLFVFKDRHLLIKLVGNQLIIYEGWSKINRTVTVSWTVFNLSLIFIYHNNRKAIPINWYDIKCVNTNSLSVTANLKTMVTHTRRVNLRRLQALNDTYIWQYGILK
jgi:hypothetical protein